MEILSPILALITLVGIILTRVITRMLLSEIEREYNSVVVKKKFIFGKLHCASLQRKSAVLEKEGLEKKKKKLRLRIDRLRAALEEFEKKEAKEKFQNIRRVSA